ncbi:MAG: DNA primase large subunit PriL [Candidatus Methanomethylicia archaeon]
MYLSKEDLAKYPFCREAREYISNLGFTLDEIFQPDFSMVLDRVFERIKSSIETGRVRVDLIDLDLEIISFHIAIIVLSIIGDDALSNRYAVSEARRVYEELRVDDDYKLLMISNGSFGWRVRGVDSATFQIFFSDFLQYAPSFEALSWKLVNRFLINGWINIGKGELARLISEKVRFDIFFRASQPPPPIAIPNDVAIRLDDLKKLFSSYKKPLEAEEFRGPSVEEAFPPCIRLIMGNLLKGESLSHMARFTLASFLVGSGRSVDDVIRLFVSSADYDEKMTKYQVEHIAGLRGSRTKYTPPKCSTLKTFGLCFPDDLCVSRRIRHPMNYYRVKLKGLGRFNVEVKGGESDKESF